MHCCWATALSENETLEITIMNNINIEESKLIAAFVGGMIVFSAGFATIISTLA